VLHNFIANLCNNYSSLAQWTATHVGELAAQRDWQAILDWKLPDAYYVHAMREQLIIYAHKTCRLSPRALQHLDYSHSS
jgi:hypothetical protein